MSKVIRVQGGAEIQIQAREWKNRIYFSKVNGRKNDGGACWDTDKCAWVNVPREFGEIVKERIAEAWGLS